MPMQVPEVVVNRLPQYVRALRELLRRNVSVANSRELGESLQMTPAQIRKDLSYFGRFGKQGRGYRIQHLLDELTQILGLDREWRIALIGIGRLGRAIISYPGFGPEGFQVLAAFDADPRQVGQAVGGLIVQPMDEMERIIRQKEIHIAIVAVPAPYAQEVVDQLVRCDVKAILNYAPVTLQVPNGVKVRSIDPVLSLQSMTYHLRSLEEGSSAETGRRTAARA
ncbi:MAG: redox-sensing transcriptional repressor Rex [Chloroflexi bacterium]|nr:redox-sensing transcriptional repressor Rex [Chloroflexota bacterium]